MLQTRSSVFKMLQEQAAKDRQILVFPKPFRTDATPYKMNDFGPSVKKACLSSLCGLRLAKAIVIGDVATGKTSLINRFCHELFDSNYKATIGVDFEVERFDVLQSPFNLQIWDTAGQERFKSIASSYYRGAHVVIIVFDMTNLVSLFHCKDWLKEALKANSHLPLIFLVGSKRDLFATREAYLEVESRVVKYACELQAEMWCVSSRTGEGILEMFHRIAALAFDVVAVQGLAQVEQLNIGSELLDKKQSQHMPRKQTINCGNCS